MDYFLGTLQTKRAIEIFQYNASNISSGPILRDKRGAWPGDPAGSQLALLTLSMVVYGQKLVGRPLQIDDQNNSLRCPSEGTLN